MCLNLNQKTENCRAARKHFVARVQSAILALLFIFTAIAPNLFAQPAPKPASGPIPNRFLIILDTSVAMKRHSADVLGIVNDLIKGAASGQMHSGDSLGLWTFNVNVFSELPAQTWTSEQRAFIAQRTLDFLQRQPLGKISRLDKALSDMQDVIRQSDIITVFIISTGEGKMRGTPFDDEINAQCHRALKDMGKQSRPVVIVLQAKSGKIIHYTVNALPWPIVIPEIPIPIKMVKGAQPATTAAAPEKISPTNVPAPKSAANLAVLPQPLSAPPKTIPSETTVQSQPIAPPPVVTLPPPPPAPEAKPEKNIPAVIATSPDATPISKHEPAPNSTAPSNTLASAPPTNAEPKILNPSTSPQSIETAKTEPKVAIPILPPLPPPETVKRIKPTPTPPAVINTNSAQASTPPPASPKPTPPPVAPASNTPTIAVAQPKSNLVAAPKPVAPPIETAPPTNNLSSHALAFVTPATPGRSKALLIASLILLLIAIVLVTMLIRRSRVTSGPSLITHSMGNRKK